MRLGIMLLGCGSITLCACNRPAQQTRNDHQPVNAATSSNAEVSSPLPADDRTPLNEPNGPIDPKNVEAAGQVVQSYGALIEQNHWTEADALWGDSEQAAKFKAALAHMADVHLEIGNLGDPEGAAGSIYVTMPVIFYGDTKDGQPFRRSADVTLRRVNDVPGSTEAQRRWHIERIDWAG
jgi:hypothetical protein